MERTTDTSKRSFTSSQPPLLPYIPQTFPQTQQKSARLCRSSTKAEQSVGDGHFVILFFPYSYPADPLDCLFSLCLKPTLDTPLRKQWTQFCACCSLSSPLSTFFCSVLKPTHFKRQLALTFVSASVSQAFLFLILLADTIVVPNTSVQLFPLKSNSNCQSAFII